eukprot:gnl/MRDRNA2_/MRDRNA2_16938_c0_seq1.p1 gnl/MRDRNA2_/MRDRNA2_16938_c0~~gnl/MRDRNA2_/MRDRNA2_16938_c0_seq1.p1  ORF type:complete len:185 (-),score=28.08 gnl/MRDRNA2_/MRDRNA2_16938_c0_seq1:30-584(-)
MHEVKKAGVAETKESLRMSLSNAELVGASNFIMWLYRHLYMLDVESGCVFVFTNRDKGVTHVAKKEGTDESPIQEIEAAPGERRIGFVRSGVKPAAKWSGNWAWDARVGGYDGHFSVNEGPEFVVTEEKEWKGQWKSFTHKAVFVTPQAMLLPRWGHVYLLNEELDTVQVWNGHGLEYAASRGQ